MRKTVGTMVVTILLLVFTAACALVEKPWQTEAALSETNELSILPEENRELGKWYYFDTTWEWDGQTFFKSTPKVEDGWIKLERNDVSGDQWKAQLLRFFDKNKTEYSFTFKVRASKEVKIPYYFGADPYIDENTAVRGTITVGTSESTVTLQLKKTFDVSGSNLKLSFEIGGLTDATIYIKPVELKSR